jgi:histidine ammonia-lyase
MIRVDDREVGLAELEAVANEATVELSGDARWLERMRRSRTILDTALDQGQPIYGVSTNVGNRSSVEVKKDLDAHAAMLVLHHGCGVGAPLSVPQARAATFARLVSLAKCYSAVRVELLEAMCRLLNANVTPLIPSLGSVGASGDLTPLSYLTCVLMGEREAIYQGEVLPAREALERAGLTPFTFAHKETLALMNGTSVMTALAVLAVLRFERAVVLTERATALMGELMHARSQAFHPIAHQVKPHPGQVASAAAIFSAMSGSGLVDQLRQGRIIQDPYSIRCSPQVLGAARDAIEWTKTALRCELNSVNDNPLVDPDTAQILFAGNFYGGHVGLTMDLAKITAATVADLVDRQLALLLDSRFNLGLPETLVTYGGNGIKGMELTSTALSALAAQRSCSDSIQSRSTEVGNQDKVSMGLNAAVNAGEVVTLLQQVLATHLIALSNAARVRGEEKLSAGGKTLLSEVRKRSAVLTADRRLDGDIAALVRFIDAEVTT